MTYEYCQRDPFGQPNLYMYTPFRGKEFLPAYFRNRDVTRARCLAAGQPAAEPDLAFTVTLADRLLELLASTLPATRTAEFLDFIGSGVLGTWPATFSPATAAERVGRPLLSIPRKATGTCDLLRELIDTSLVNKPGQVEKRRLDRMVRRFEVAKRLYEHYPPALRKGAGSFVNPRVYWLFSLTLAIYYLRSGNLKYLNTLLKVSDLLCSMDASTVFQAVPKQGMLLVLALEVSCVRSIAQINGVSHETG